MSFDRGWLLRNTGQFDNVSWGSSEGHSSRTTVNFHNDYYHSEVLTLPPKVALLSYWKLGV